MFGVMSHLSVVCCEDADEAIEKGFDYKDKGIKAVEIKKVVVVKQGTLSGGSTVDFLMEDENGQQYVVMMTGNLLKMVPC